MRKKSLLPLSTTPKNRHNTPQTWDLTAELCVTKYCDYFQMHGYDIPNLPPPRAPHGEDNYVTYLESDDSLPPSP